MNDNEKLNAELLDLLAAGRKIQAIKRYRESTGAGLAAAKAAVENLERGGELPPPPTVEPLTEREVLAQWDERGKIAAIKFYREATGAGLKEAKEAVEAIGARHGYAPPVKAGCLSLIGLLVMTFLPVLIPLL
jgi:ribosomal protein L7/L12